MTIQLTAPALREIFPCAPQAVIDAMAAKQGVFDAAGITHTRTRLAYCMAHVEHECGGFTIKNLTENTNYSPRRIVQVWPNRYRSVDEVIAKFGNPIDKQAFFDEVYGGRMGNRRGTHDGSRYIGRGGPQITGRDGYAEVGRRAGLPLEAQPELAGEARFQPEIIAAFWSWKNLNAKADIGDFRGSTRLWNGGTNGLADREAQLAGNDPIIARLQNVNRAAPVVKQLPGDPPTKAPPKDVVDEATKKERAARKGGVVAGGAGGVNETAKTQQPDTVPLSSPVAYGLIAVGVVVVIVATILIARKKAAVIRNWF